MPKTTKLIRKKEVKLGIFLISLCLLSLVVVTIIKNASIGQFGMKFTGINGDDNSADASSNISTPQSRVAGASIIDSQKCSSLPALKNLEKSNLRELRLLNSYQKLCSSFVTKNLMIFIYMPTSESSAKDLAEGLSPTLKELYKYGVKSNLVMEPLNYNGANIKVSGIASGQQDKYLQIFFSKLKASGISGKEIGLWIPYPEINTPDWDTSNFTPQTFPKIVTKFFSILRKEYPSARGSILLNSMTYSPKDTNWENGKFISFSNYINGIPAGTVESFGISGFPWKQAANEHDMSPSIVASQFLARNLASEAAKKLNTKKIWFNTGTFSSMYSGKRKIYMSAEERSTVLTDIYNEAKKLQSEGFIVSVNIFAENKSATKERTDWSYGNISDINNPFRKTIYSFIKKFYGSNIEFSLFLN